ncbi:MAG: DNA replication/repair protein RecF [bacterium]
MLFERLYLENFRSLERCLIDDLSKVNFFYGNNGAGKTSVLEAMHVLSVGHSFRPVANPHLVRFGEDQFTVAARLTNTRAQSIGLRYSGHSSSYKVDGKATRSVAPLSASAPVIVSDPVSNSLLITEASSRRKFLDWGCFQSDNEYLKLWREYSKVLSQRNAAIKQSGSSELISCWDSKLARLGLELTSRRNDYALSIETAFSALAENMDLSCDLSIRFSPGWNPEEDLYQVLSASIDADRKRGYTYHGSHRDDLRLETLGKPFNRVGSRGQLKVVALLLRLAQARLATREGEAIPALLFDDLSSEMDSFRLEEFWRLVDTVGGQVFLTGTTEPPEFMGKGLRLFHVKHGSVYAE